MKRMAGVTMAWLLMTVSGCAYHNIPTQKHWVANSEVMHRHMVFLDQDGDIYPKDFSSNNSGRVIPFWQDAYRIRVDQDFKKHGKIYDRQEIADQMIGDIVSDIRMTRQEKTQASLVFLVHGFDSSIDDSRSAYANIREKVEAVNKDGQVFVELFWDGLHEKAEGRQILFWDSAVGYSQMAGINGFRRILAGIPDDIPIRIITHSRGASVALSAISDPPFDSGFVMTTNESLRNDASIREEPKELWSLSKRVENGEWKNRDIRMALLAPAVGEIDFMKKDATGVCVCGDFKPREFSGLHFIVVGFNESDPVLRKKIPKKYKGAFKFNGTGFGLDVEVYERVSAGLESMKEPVLVKKESYYNMNEHGFEHYINRDDVFEKKILPSLFYGL